MRLILAAGAALTLAALPALAETTTVEFAASDGTKTVVVFNGDGTASVNGADPAPYTMDEEAKKVCGPTPDGDVCATFDEWNNEVGFSTGYTNDTGDKGTATITAKE